ncbi:phage capsid protein [Pseudoalteromonas marina]|uniref:phage capsid protein n=1 Tax=Pseudoalteromonas marina TaxID=267375 RepID=UPI003C54BAA5
MSKFLSDVARTEFDSMVKPAYQGGSKLRDTVEYRGNVVGDTYKFRLMGKGQGHKRSGSSSLVVPMNITHGLPTATLADWEHPEYTDIFDQATVNFDEKNKLATTIGKAMGRTEDQIIIDKVVAGTYNTTATDAEGFDIAAGGTGFTAAKLRTLRAYYDDLEVDEDVNILVSGSGMESLLANTETTSSDYNTVKALVGGSLSSFMGFNFIKVGARRLEGGLGGSGLIAYAYAPDSVGLAAASLEKSMGIDWIAERTSWLCNGTLKAGAAIIDPEGTARIAFA